MAGGPGRAEGARLSDVTGSARESPGERKGELKGELTDDGGRAWASGRAS